MEGTPGPPKAEARMALGGPGMYRSSLTCPRTVTRRAAALALVASVVGLLPTGVTTAAATSPPDATVLSPQYLKPMARPSQRSVHLPMPATATPQSPRHVSATATPTAAGESFTSFSHTL